MRSCCWTLLCLCIAIAGCGDPNDLGATAPPAALSARVLPEHVFARLSARERGRLYEEMEYMGARAAGLWTDRERDVHRGPAGWGTPLDIIGSADQEVNGLTEAGTQ